MSATDHLDAVLDIWSEDGVTSRCTITGDCMSPLIRRGDRLVIRFGTDDLRVGDVIVYGSPGKLVAHRLLRIVTTAAGEVFVLMADGSRRFDPSVSRGEIVGKVIDVEGAGGRHHYDTPFWRVANRLLAHLSYVRGRQRRPAPLPWEAARRGLTRVLSLAGRGG